LASRLPASDRAPPASLLPPVHVLGCASEPDCARLRYRGVTGLHTCAPPIFQRRSSRRVERAVAVPAAIKTHRPALHVESAVVVRSEERRVGKECRSLRTAAGVNENMLWAQGVVHAGVEGQTERGRLLP